MAEPRIVNSGLLQGQFLNRQKVKKQIENPEEFIHWKDINLGINLNINEHVIRITNCDDFTKVFYQEMECPLGEAEDIPQDNYEILKILKEVKIPPPDTKEYKEYFEVKLGGGHPNTGLHQYLGKDRQVLSFKVLWDDRSLEGDVNYFEMNYFLADDTVEVKEMNKNNSGKEPFPLLLRRGKLPKTPLMTFYPGMTLEKEEFYGPNDLYCGNSIQIYGRGCLIYNCDDFTKEYYRKKLLAP